VVERDWAMVALVSVKAPVALGWATVTAETEPPAQVSATGSRRPVPTVHPILRTPRGSTRRKAPWRPLLEVAWTGSSRTS